MFLAVALLVWRRPPLEADNLRERFVPAIRAGGRFAWHAPVVRRILLRAIYTVIFMGSQAGAALLWGLAADRLGLQPAVVLAAGVTLVGVVAGGFWRVPETEHLDVQPAIYWPDARLAFLEANAERRPTSAWPTSLHLALLKINVLASCSSPNMQTPKTTSTSGDGGRCLS